MLNRDFFCRGAVELAPELLGKVLVHKTPEGLASGIIVETEAYAGPEDLGAHSCRGRKTARTQIMYGPGGFAYVYLIYGFYSCFNVVADREERPQAVLVRAVEPLEGVGLMKRRRGTEDLTNLCSGPGKLCTALWITRAQYGADLLGDELYLEDRPPVPGDQIMVSPRINIDYAGEYRDKLWRFYLADSPFVSRVPRRYRDAAVPLETVSDETKRQS